jgi:HAMP domain-containing protein
MAEPVLERRVDRLEDLMAELIRESAQTHVEMRAFKDEMSAFKDEMGAFRIEMRRSWGELSNRLGTMAEDLVAPSVPRVLSTVIGCPEDRIDNLALRVFRRSSVRLRTTASGP